MTPSVDCSQFLFVILAIVLLYAQQPNTARTYYCAATMRVVYGDPRVSNSQPY